MHVAFENNADSTNYLLLLNIDLKAIAPYNYIIL